MQLGIEKHFCERLQCVTLRQTSTCRSSRSEVFCEKGVLESFAKFTEKLLCWSIFISGDFPKKWLQHWSVLGNFANFLRTPIFENTWGRLLLTVDFFLEVSGIFQKIFESSNEHILLIYIIQKQMFLIMYIVQTEILKRNSHQRFN